MEELLGTFLLGVGGNEPCLELYSVAERAIIKAATFQKPNSVYSVDVGLEDGSIAVGTRGGNIFILDPFRQDSVESKSVCQKLVQGAPVLSVSWIDKSYLAASDTAGRILIWQTGQPSQTPTILHKADGTICSLKKGINGSLASLSSEGVFQLWDTSAGHEIYCTQICSPPSIAGFVQMVNWPIAGAFACPGGGGELSIINPNTGSVKTVFAHDDEFYALSCMRDKLVTVGMGDGHLKVWSPSFVEPDFLMRVPKNIVAVKFTQDPPFKIILVELDGKAGVYSFDNDQLNLEYYLAGRNYRTVIRPLPENERINEPHQLEEKARAIIAEIEKKAVQGETDDLKVLHQNLVELGYEHASIAIRIDHAERLGNPVEAIRLCQALMQMLPTDDPRICPSIEKYARILAQLWDFKEAKRLCQQIQQLAPDYEFAIKPEKISKQAELLDNDNWVIEPDAGIDVIINSATAIGKKFYGRYLINKLPPINAVQAEININTLCDKYDQLREDNSNDPLPQVNQEKVYWLTRQGIEQIDLVAFKNEVFWEFEGLSLGMQIINGNLNNTIIIPTVIFDWRHEDFDLSIEEENTKALNTLKYIQTKKDLLNPYLAKIHSAFLYALRRLVTEYHPRQEYQ